MDKLRVLHVSDLHERGPREREAFRRRRLLGDAWARNLEAILTEGAIDLVCFTGDVADWGAPTEYEAATAFIEDLLRQLELSRERVFIVPGNHDIARGTEAVAWHGLRDALARGADRLNVGRWMAGLIKEAPLGMQAEWRDAVLSRQAAYRAWLRSLGREALAAEDALGWQVTLALEGWPELVHIIGLDTAWLAGDDADAGRLLLTDAQLGHRATDAEGNALQGLRLALMHHPFHDLADGHAVRHLAAELIDVVLRGHQHQTGIHTWQILDRRGTEFAVGCLYEGHRVDQYPNACQVLTLSRGTDGALTGQNHFRAWAPAAGHWHDDDSLYSASSAGRLPWTLPVPARPAAVPSRPRADAPLNPFDPWNPALPPRFVGRLALSRDLDRALAAGRSVAVVGDWRVGKSSVLRTWELRAKAAGRVVVWVSGEESAGRSPAAFVHALTGLDVAEDAEAAADSLERWAARVAPPDLPPLVLVDEASTPIRTFDPRFFERLRGLLTRHALVVALCTVEEIDRIYQRLGRASPFHNLIETQPVGLLEAEAAEALVQRGGSALAETDRAMLRAWAGRHAFFLQLLGYYLVQGHEDGEPREASLRRFQDEAASRIRAVWALLSEREQQALREGSRTGLPIDLHALQRRGLVTEDGRIFGRVLTEWLKENA